MTRSGPPLPARPPGGRHERHFRQHQGRGQRLLGNDKAKELAAEHGDKVDAAVDAATDKVDDLTGGSSTIVTDKVDEAVDAATDKAAE